MKIEWKKYNHNRDEFFMLCCNPHIQVIDTSTLMSPKWSVDNSDLFIIGQKEYGSSYLAGVAIDGFDKTSFPLIWTSYAGGGEILFSCSLFKNITGEFAGYSGAPGTICFENCVLDNVDFSKCSPIPRFLFLNCVLKNVKLVNRPVMANCITDQQYWSDQSIEFNQITYRSHDNIIGSGMFRTTDISDLWSSKGTGTIHNVDLSQAIDNHNGNGYVRMAKVFGDDYDSYDFLSRGMYPFFRSYVLSPTSYYWTPSYACNESKRIIFHNNQDYVDLDGIRRNYFDKTFTEITLDFSKNGLTKDDMTAIKEMYENADNEITIYPYDNNDSKYIVGRLSKSDLDYSKIINSFWDSGEIDNERFNGVRLVIRVTDDSHFTEGV